jgi:hypothetical protein
MLNKCLNYNLFMKVPEFQAFIEQYPEYEPLFEYVSASYRQHHHYRFIPETRWSPTQAQLYARLQFTLASYHSYGSKGFAELEGNSLPVVAVAVAKRMKGKKYTEKKPLTESPSFWSELKRRFRKRMFQEPEKLRTKKLKRIAYGQEQLRPQGEALVLPIEVKPEKKTPSLTYAQVGYYAKQLGEMNMRVIDDVFAGRKPRYYHPKLKFRRNEKKRSY